MSVGNWVTIDKASKLHLSRRRRIKMFVRFQIFVLVMCFFYHGVECITRISKFDKKLGTSFEERGGRSTRSLLDLKSEDALENVKRVVEYFENDGPMREVKLREPSVPSKCGQCSTDSCKSCEANLRMNVPLHQPSTESKENFVSARMENNWCPATMLGISHHVKSQPPNIHFRDNEIVGSPRESKTPHADICKKKAIIQPGVKEKMNYGYPKYYYVPQPLQSNPRSFHTNEDFFFNPSANIRMGQQQIALPTQQVALTSLDQNQPLELLQSPLPQQRSFFGTKYPQGSLTTPHLGLGIPSSSLVAPSMCLGSPQFILTPILGLFAPKLPFKLFHRNLGLSENQFSVATPRMGLSLPTDDLNSQIGTSTPQLSVVEPRMGLSWPTDGFNSQIRTSTPQLSAAAPRMGSSLSSDGLNSRISQLPSVSLRVPRKRLLPSLGLGLKPLNLHLGLPLNCVTSYPVTVTAPQLEMNIPHNNLYSIPSCIHTQSPSTYPFNRLLPIFSRKTLYDETSPEFDTFEEFEEDVTHQATAEQKETQVDENV